MSISRSRNHQTDLQPVTFCHDPSPPQNEDGSVSDSHSDSDSGCDFDFDVDDDSPSDWEPIVPAPASVGSDDSSDSHSNSSLSGSDSDGDNDDLNDSYDEKELVQKVQLPKSPRSLLLLFPLLLLSTLQYLHTTRTTIPISFPGEESIYVPGVGFSGFWFTLGRLKSIPDPAKKHFVCFSAGCLGAVTILNNFNVHEMACMAQTAQTNWRNGTIDRFQVVQQFVHGLVYRQFPDSQDPLGCLAQHNLLPLQNNHNNRVPIDHPNLFSRLHILTTQPADTFSSGLLVKATMRSPTNLNELEEMLIQTAWIPIATGDALTYKGHMDGGFSLWQHPKCDKSVTLPLNDPRLLFNSLNVNMPVQEAYRLWNQGLAYGL